MSRAGWSFMGHCGHSFVTVVLACVKAIPSSWLQPSILLLTSPPLVYSGYLYVFLYFLSILYLYLVPCLGACQSFYI